MVNIKSVWQGLLNIGVTDDLDFELVRKVRIENGIAILYGLLNLLISIWGMVLNLPYLTLLNYSETLMMIVVVILNHHRFYNSSRIMLFFAVTFHVTVVSLIFDIGVEYYLFPLLIVAGFLFNNRRQLIFYFLFISLLYLISKSRYFDGLLVDIDPEYVKLIQITDGILALNLTLLAINLFLMQYEHHRKTIVAKYDLLQKVADTASEKVDFTTLLLKEMNHRVKNNLQLISSLLNIHAKELEDEVARDALNEARNRIYSIALIHRQLYKEDNYSMLSITEYVNDLIPHIKDTMFNPKIETDLDVFTDSFYLRIEDAVVVGLIINELVTNSIKHGIIDGQKNKIEIRIKYLEDQMINISVEDSGNGIDAISNSGELSFGLKLVETLAQSHNGKMIIDGEVNKITVELRFEEENIKPLSEENTL